MLISFNLNNQSFSFFSLNSCANLVQYHIIEYAKTLFLDFSLCIKNGNFEVAFVET